MKQQGFTLIELVVVIVILGILSVVVAPKLIDLEGDAHQGVVEGIAGAAASAASINFASCAMNGHNQTNCAAGGCIRVATCAGIEGLVPDIDWNVGTATVPATTGYHIAASVQDTEPDTNGERVDCTVTDNASGKTATFKGIGACN